MKKTILFIALMMALSLSRAFAQTGEIIYRDFEPDSILIYWHKLGPVWIDLDLDGEANEFYMKMWVAGSVCAPEHQTIGNKIRMCTIEPENIDVPLTEVPEEDWRWYVGWAGGPEACRYTRYGFRIRRIDGYYYGWFETYDRVISTKNGKQIVHHGFDRTAYCTIPNYPLRWGQTDLYDDVEEASPNSFATVLPNPNNGVFTVVGENLRQIEVLDVLGQRIATLQANSDRTTIDLSGQPAGVYLINVTDHNGRQCVKKVVKN